METTIYFFTGTGNSLKIAKAIAEKLSDSKLLPIAKLWQKEEFASTTEKVGFIFPLYYSGLPKIVYDFINKLDLSKSYYIFTIITSAGDINEFPLQQLNKILQTKAKKLSAGFFVKMPNNFIIGFDVHSEKKQKEFFKKASEQIELISEIISHKKENLNQDLYKKNVTRSERINTTFREEVFQYDKSFYTDENCNTCGICERVCPVNNIILINYKPEWQHNCQLCLACINFCPEKSIQFGNDTLKTQRYHHPDITLQEIINQHQ